MREFLTPTRKIITPRLPSHIKLDMAFGLGTGTTLFDKSRFRSHGTITGAEWATGAHGYCLDFDSSVYDHVSIPSTHTQLDFTSEAFSLVIRAYVESVSAHMGLFSRYEWAVDGYALLLLQAGYLYFVTEQSEAEQSSQGNIGDISAGNWYTFGVSRDGATVTLYQNGVDITAIHGTHLNPATCNRAAKISVLGDFNAYAFDGKIEFLRIFGGIALSASEHLAYHNALA